MGIDDSNLHGDEVGSRLRGLFQSAKAEDEFEFACTLMRVRGMEDLGWILSWRPNSSWRT